MSEKEKPFDDAVTDTVRWLVENYGEYTGDFLESQMFYEACQLYRHSPVGQQCYGNDAAAVFFEALKVLIQGKFIPRNAT